MATPTGRLRIGELSRRVGVSPELLRAWEARYGLLRPERSPGGFRLYSARDEARVRTMKEHLGQGLSAAEAARLAASRPGTATAPTGGAAAEFSLTGRVQSLASALDRFDDAHAQVLFDELLAAYSLETVLSRVVLPLLRTLGERWESGEVSVAQEHFASHVLRGRLLGLARCWDEGSGPRALLACPPGELHDLGLIIFGLALRGHGWRITFIGADAPLDTIVSTARSLSPDVVFVAATSPDALEDVASALAATAPDLRVVLAGPAAASLGSVPGRVLADVDPVTAAHKLADDFRGR